MKDKFIKVNLKDKVNIFKQSNLIKIYIYMKANFVKVKYKVLEK
jgi:hypothetical protein